MLYRTLQNHLQSVTPRVLAVMLLVAGATASALGAQAPGSDAPKTEAPASWFVSVSHRIDVERGIQQYNQYNQRSGTGEVQQIGPPVRHVTNITSGIVLDAEGHVATRLVNLDPTSPRHNLNITTSTGRIVPAELVGLDVPSGIAILRAPDLRGIQPMPSLASPPLQPGEAITILAPEYTIRQLRDPIERFAASPTILLLPAIVARPPDEPASKLAGIVSNIHSSAIEASNDLSIVRTHDGRIVGILKYVMPGHGQIVGTPFLRETVLARVLSLRGNVLAGWLGAEGRTFMAPPRMEPPQPDTRGVLIERIDTGGPADTAGLELGDLVVGFDDIQISDVRGLASAIRSVPAKTRISLKVFRGGSPVTISPVLGARPLGPDPSTFFGRNDRLQQRLTEPENQALNERLINEQDPAVREEYRRTIETQGGLTLTMTTRLGLFTTELQTQMGTWLGISNGLVVERVSNGLPAEKAGLRASDVITRVGDVALTDRLVFEKALQDAKTKGTESLVLTVRRRDLAEPILVTVTLPRN